MNIVKTFTYENDDGEEVTVDLPGRWRICTRCQGEGKSSAHLGAITADEWARDWSFEEQEGYLRGDYDKTCEVCAGSGKVWEVDTERLPREVRKRMEDHERWAAEDRAIRRMESGGYD